MRLLLALNETGTLQYCRDQARSSGAMNYTTSKPNWLPDMDLNHDKQIQSLLCYRYTIGQTGRGKVGIGLKESRKHRMGAQIQTSNIQHSTSRRIQRSLGGMESRLQPAKAIDSPKHLQWSGSHRCPRFNRLKPRLHTSEALRLVVFADMGRFHPAPRAN
jgi:hypothetical protein